MSEVMTIRVDRKTKTRLEKLAEATDRTKSYLAAEAIRAYVELNEWQIAEIKKAVKEADTPSARWVDHEEVQKWLASWGISRERKPPL
jgi:RHH-type rel operon transcriptional repressor/antitoxin RelB